MIAFKFLAKGGLGPFTGYAWPIPSPGGAGPWVTAPDGDSEQRGIHACRELDLSYWLDEELWQIELAGSIREYPTQVVAERGRLLERVEAWTAASRHAFAEACLLQSRDAIVSALRARGAAAAAEALADCDDVEGLAAVARSLAATVPLVGFVSDAVATLRDGGAAAAVAANAVAIADPSPDAVASERQRQSRWLIGYLGLAP